MARTNSRERARSLRQKRVRDQIHGTNVRPRLSIYRSGRHMYAQVISDESGTTVTSASTLSSELRGAAKKTATVDAAKEVGALIARKCQEKGISQVVFDRNGFLYHGRVRAVADGAREGGLQF
ncbi:MAG: 50S ribosomal protein L18 [Deltaproteobacteria bacterium]|nr:50S ribosomal protein L18 [Deltaproteobacteria bacterium]